MIVQLSFKQETELDQHLKDTLYDQICEYTMDRIEVVTGVTELLKVELDAVQPEELFNSSVAWPDGVFVRMKDPMGPGGGWPVLEIIGPREGLQKFVMENWGIGEVSEFEGLIGG